MVSCPFLRFLLVDLCGFQHCLFSLVGQESSRQTFVFMLLLVQSTHGLFSLVSKGWLARISLSCLSHGFGGFQQLFFVDDCGFWWKWILGDATFGPIKHFTIWQAIRDHVKGRSAGSFCRSLKCKLWADSSIGFACFGVAVILGKMCFRSGVSDFAFV